MPTRSIILIVLAVVLAGATAILARGLMTQEPAQQQTALVQEKKSTRVLVAIKPMPLGQIIKPEDLRWQSWPDDRLHGSYLVEGVVNANEFTGHVVRDSITAGEPVTRVRLAAPGTQNFLAAALAPGMRAVTVPINQISGVAGFIFPGDRVDLILNHQVNDADDNPRQVSETVIQNLRILAIDSRTRTGPNPDGSPASPQTGNTATLEVTPKIAEKIALVSQLGSLTLALRSLATDTETNGSDIDPAKAPPDDTLTSYTWDADVSRLLSPVDPEKGRTKVHLSRGGELSVIEFSEEPGR